MSLVKQLSYTKYVWKVRDKITNTLKTPQIIDYCGSYVDYREEFDTVAEAILTKERNEPLAKLEWVLCEMRVVPLFVHPIP